MLSTSHAFFSESVHKLCVYKHIIGFRYKKKTREKWLTKACNKNDLLLFLPSFPLISLISTSYQQNKGSRQSTCNATTVERKKK